jgi:chaperone modulatory protein CbpM
VTDPAPNLVFGVVVEEEVRFTLLELGRACRAEGAQLTALVAEGVLTPSGADEQNWQFDGSALRRARAALRLSRDFELSAANTAFVLDLLDQIEALKSRLRQVGSG